MGLDGFMVCKPIVTAIGHGRVIMQESKDYYEDRKWGRRLAGLRALATVKD